MNHQIKKTQRLLFFAQGKRGGRNNDNVLKFAKIRPMRVEMYLRVPYGQPLRLLHTLQARVNALQRTAGRLPNRRRYSPSLF